jgi:hypothetical protein
VVPGGSEGLALRRRPFLGSQVSGGEGGRAGGARSGPRTAGSRCLCAPDLRHADLLTPSSRRATTLSLGRGIRGRGGAASDPQRVGDGAAAQTTRRSEHDCIASAWRWKSAARSQPSPSSRKLWGARRRSAPFAEQPPSPRTFPAGCRSCGDAGRSPSLWLPPIYRTETSEQSFVDAGLTLRYIDRCRPGRSTGSSDKRASCPRRHHPRWSRRTGPSTAGGGR